MKLNIFDILMWPNVHSHKYQQFAHNALIVHSHLEYSMWIKKNPVQHIQHKIHTHIYKITERKHTKMVHEWKCGHWTSFYLILINIGIDLLRRDFMVCKIPSNVVYCVLYVQYMWMCVWLCILVLLLMATFLKVDFALANISLQMFKLITLKWFYSGKSTQPRGGNR